ncbi:MAG: lysophospholipid acyltransferase family protein [Candidatus Paceibacterota bacterium]|jgi:1-acyl-sn-glycerol-3-phosphate acyltransferase
MGYENIKDLKPGVVFALNHTSEWDPIVFANGFNIFSKMIPLYTTSREKNFYKTSALRSIFYGGNLFRFMGAFPVVVGVKNYERSLAFHIKMLKNGKNVLIFPEGHCTKDGKLQPAKGGVVALARAANVPVIPVGVTGLFNITPKEFFLRKRRVGLYFGKPIYPNELFLENGRVGYSAYPQIANEIIMSKIAELIDL